MAWTIDQLNDTLKTHSDPSTLDGFMRKSYAKGKANVQVAEGAREFIATVTTSTVDRDQEIIEPAGIDLSTYKTNPIILWSHRHDEPAIGRSVWIKHFGPKGKTKGLMSRGKIAEGIAKAAEIFSLMQQGILNTVSIGFIPLTGHDPTADEAKANSTAQWIWDKVVMLEYSIVNVPSNPQATIEAVSKGIISESLASDLAIDMPDKHPEQEVVELVEHNEPEPELIPIIKLEPLAQITEVAESLKPAEPTAQELAETSIIEVHEKYQTRCLGKV